MKNFKEKEKAYQDELKKIDRLADYAIWISIGSIVLSVLSVII